MSTNDTFADPVPLGLTGFGLTTFIVGMIEAQWLGSGVMNAAIPLAIAYGGTIQLFAGLLSFRKGDTFATVAFNTYGAYWWWFALAELFSMNGILNPSTTGLGVVNLGFGIITAYLFVGSLTESAGLAAVFATLSLTYSLIGIGDWIGVGVVAVWGGYFGMLCALLAVYVAFGHVINSSFGQDLVPLGSAPAERSQGQALESSD